MLKGPKISSTIISQGIRTTFTVFFRCSTLKILACLTISLPSLVLAQVPPVSASQPAAKVSARAYGAQCTGQGDDTAAIQAALDVQSAFNVAVLKNVNVDVELPQGTCVLSAPLRMGLYGSLVGQNDATTILAHYDRWQSKDYAAIDVAITGPIPSGEAVGQRRISNLRLLGANNSKIAHSVGIHIHNTVPKYELQYQVSYFNLADLFISGFDTGIEAEDWESSSIDNVNITAVRQG